MDSEAIGNRFPVDWVKADGDIADEYFVRLWCRAGPVGVNAVVFVGGGRENEGGGRFYFWKRSNGCAGG